MFVFFLCVGRYLEMRARHRAGDLSDALARLTPVFADRVEVDGSLLRVGALELVAGDRVLVADGVGVPADGLLESAECRVDEAMLSGESMPVTKRRGDSVCAGTVVVGSPATVCVSRVGAETVVAGIVALTARAATTRPQMTLADERAAARFVARVLVVGIVHRGLSGRSSIRRARWRQPSRCWWWHAPCAFALAGTGGGHPYTGGTHQPRHAGRAPRCARANSRRRLDVLFDKTGTLTEPWIASRPHDDAALDDGSYPALALAAALAQGSRHRSRVAFTAAAPATLPAVDARASLVGHGIGGVIDGRSLSPGSSPLRIDARRATAAGTRRRRDPCRR